MEDSRQRVIFCTWPEMASTLNSFDLHALLFVSSFLRGNSDSSLFYMGYLDRVTLFKMGRKQYLKVNAKSLDTQAFSCIKKKLEDELVGCTT